MNNLAQLKLVDKFVNASRKKAPSIILLSELNLHNKSRSTLGDCSCHRFHLSRNTQQLESWNELHWDKFSLVTGSREEEREWLMCERKTVY